MKGQYLKTDQNGAEVFYVPLEGFLPVMFSVCGSRIYYVLLGPLGYRDLEVKGSIINRGKRKKPFCEFWYHLRAEKKAHQSEADI